MDNRYIPATVKIQRIVRETPDIKTFYLKQRMDFIPGQFLEVACFGFGEVPISISSGPGEDSLRISFKCVGKVTEAMFNLKADDTLGIRGPFGNGFSLGEEQGKDILLVAGGIGLAPLRSLIKFILANGDYKGRMILVYGARSPKDVLYKKELKDWGKDVEVLLTVDNPDTRWKGGAGVVTQYLSGIKADFSKLKAFLCGPEVMMRFATAKLLERGVKPRDIVFSLERHMQCGMGKCGHCYIGEKFVCRDGPVFTYEALNKVVPINIW